jgi:NADH dehydrogenase FAD-containing subunit
MARPPKLLSSGNESGKGVVIVGGGAGAFHTVESLREVYFHAFRDPAISDDAKHNVAWL